MDKNSLYKSNSNLSHEFIDRNESNILQKQRFDDRSETSVNLSLKLYLKSNFDFSSIISNLDESFNDENSFEWSTTKKITQVINSSNFESKYGKVLIVNPTSIYIAFGTNRGFIIGFNYLQEIEFVLSSKDNIGSESPITCMAFSSDSTFMATANEIGEIIIWNLSSKSVHSEQRIIFPHFIINPVTLEQRFNENKDGHLINDKINYIKFVGSSNLQIISSNTSGLIFYHHGFRKFMKNYFITQKILGNNDANAKNSKFLIQDMEVLPLGSDYNIIDDLGIFAVLTSSSLSIMSLLSLNNSSNINLKTHLVIGKPKTVNNHMLRTTGCIGWFPSIKKGHYISNPLLAYAWNNVMTIVELDKTTFPDNFIGVINEARDKDKLLPSFIINKTCRWITNNFFNMIIGIKWLSPELLTVFTQNDKERKAVKIITFYYTNKGKGNHSLIEIGNDKLNDFELISNPQSNVYNDGTLKPEFYDVSINCIKTRLMIFVNSDNLIQLKIGKAFTWSDRLSNLLAKEEYSKALMSVYSFYITNNMGQIVLIGLPKNKIERNKLVVPILLKILFKSIKKLLNPYKKNDISILKFYYEVIATLFVEGHHDNLKKILDELFEVFNNRNEFFEQLESYILSGRILSLSPIILQKLVEYYVEEKDGHKLTEIICLLDIQSLDIDLTVQLCNKYKLRDCLIYIWNHILGDYRTPLIDFINDIQKKIELEECNRVFPYISFILSGRQYPTDRFIGLEKEEMARESITKIIFSSDLIPLNNEITEETIFPYLYILLKFNSFEMLSALNEYFEESFLNNSENINRQFIIEALLDVFEANEFPEYDRCQFSIFIARNYPKYPQFIRLPESVLSNTIEILCKSKDKKVNSDCELALQSLLSIYEPDDSTILIERLKTANFNNVLLNIYRTEGKYSKVVEIWLKKQKSDDIESNFETLETILENSFLKVKTTMERINLLNIIKDNFSTFVEFDVVRFYTIIQKYAPTLHDGVLKLDSSHNRYEYLKLYFNDHDKNYMQQFERSSEFLSVFIQDLIKFSSEELPKFLKIYGHHLIKNKYECNKCIEILKVERLVNCYTILYIILEQYEESLKTLLDYIKSIIENSDNDTDKEIQKCVQLAMTVCEKSEKNDKQIESSLNFNEKLWLHLIKYLIELSNQEMLVVSRYLLINKCIHDCFIRISELKLNHKNNNKESFLKIFNSFLNDTVYDAATLQNVRGILQDVFISYSYESEMLQISFKMLNMSIYKSMEMIKVENIKGWFIKSKFCASCGKVMWGNNIDESHYSAWEDRHKNLLLVENDLNIISKVVQNTNSLVFFKCNHGYHFTCLENLGYHKVKECAICT